MSLKIRGAALCEYLSRAGGRAGLQEHLQLDDCLTYQPSYLFHFAQLKHIPAANLSHANMASPIFHFKYLWRSGSAPASPNH